MTVAITIHLFQAVYTGHGCFGRFWEIATYISVMVNGHCIHFYKNKYNKLTPSYIINTFILTTQCKRVNGTTCSATILLTADYIVISKGKGVLHCTFCIPVLFIQTLHTSLLPLPQSYRVLVFELQGRWLKWKKNKRNGWKKKRFKYPQQSNSLFCWLFRPFNS